MQIVRFIIVGLVSNAFLYVIFLLAIYLGVEDKTAMSWLFALGALQTFFFNKRWSFSHAGWDRYLIFRYSIAYVVAYFLNLLALLIFVDKIGIAARYVQGSMTVFIAIFLFSVQRYWVFHRLQDGEE